MAVVDIAAIVVAFVLRCDECGALSYGGAQRYGGSRPVAVIVHSPGCPREHVGTSA